MHINADLKCANFTRYHRRTLIVYTINRRLVIFGVFAYCTFLINFENKLLEYYMTSVEHLLHIFYNKNILYYNMKNRKNNHKINRSGDLSARSF